MQVTGERVTREKVNIEVHPFEMWKSLKRMILQKNGMSGVEYLRGNGTSKNPYVMKQDDPHHRHGSISEEVVIENPSDKQVEIWQALDKLNRLIKFNELED